MEGYALFSALQILHLSEEDLEAVVVFWIEEWSVEFGHHRFDDAHVHDQSGLPISLRLVDHFDVPLDPRMNVPVVPVRNNFTLECKDLNISV